MPLCFFMFAMTMKETLRAFSNCHISTWHFLSYSVASDFASKALNRKKERENVFKLIESYFFPFHLFIFCFKGPIHYSWVQSRNLILIQPYYLFSYFMLYHLHRQWPQLIHFVYLQISSVCQVIGGHLSISWYSELLCVYYLCKPLVRGPVSSK